jgi:hypothetical protein
MKLSYRGANYEMTVSSIETTESETIGKYRGVAVRFSAPVGTPTPQSAMRLNYRGAAYLGFR